MKRLLNLRNNWAVITDGKVAHIGTVMAQPVHGDMGGGEVGGSGEQGGFLGSVSLHRLSHLPEISDFCLFSESVMFNLHVHTSFRT